MFHKEKAPVHSYLQQLNELSTRNTRTIVGLMSGTSLDGLDIALVQITGHDLNTQVSVKEFVSIPYNKTFLDIIAPIFANPNAPLSAVCDANVLVAKQHAAMLLATLKTWKIDTSSVDIIASHGQTIFHHPNAAGTCTLQIGDGDHIAQLCQTITVSDFRQKHTANGGEGAPLVPYADYLLFNHGSENRVLLNIGGISNFTYLPKNSDFNSVLSADIGPGNTLMDAVVKAHQLTPLGYDESGKCAASGSINESLLESLLSDDFFTHSSLSSTGPEYFNLAWLNRKLKKCNLRSGREPISHADLLATLNRFSAQIIANALALIVTQQDLSLYISGGGAYNQTLVNNIMQLMPYCSVKQADQLGIKASAKEAVLFAVLANQTLFGNSTIFKNSRNIPAVGLGKISLPN